MMSVVVILIFTSLWTSASCDMTDAQMDLLRFVRKIESINKNVSETISQANVNSSTSAHNSSNIERYEVIYPGTKWCGAGNISTGYNDLGIFRREDMCCRAHDYCTPQLYSYTNSSQYGISNMTPISKLECSCDTSFYKCLKSVGSVVATSLGNIYFNLLGNQCFRKDYPITGCKTYYVRNLFRCKVYTYNKKGKQIYQYFDSAIY